MELFQHIWSQALTTVVGAEEEVQKLLHKLLGLSQEELKKLDLRLESQRKALEGRLEEVVKTSVARLRVPRREEVEQLNHRLDQLTARVEALTK